MRRNKDSEGSLVATVVDAIERMISHGELVPGQRIVESELARRLSVSRNPVREAVRVLAGDGVLELIHNRGSQVRRMDSKELGDMLAVLGMMMKLSLKEVALQPNLKAVIANLESVALKIKQAREQNNPVEFIKWSSRFHEDLVIASGNEYTLYIIRRAHFGSYDMQLLQALPSDEIMQAEDFYAPILSALRSGNWRMAQDLAEDMLDINVNKLRACT